jgi:branched-chain amino acid transport system substrate-binding protein
MIVGMALQLNLANVFSGIAMNLEAKVRLNDWVMIHSRTQREEEGLVGRVVDIGWRTTQLVTTGGNLVTVPNNEFSQKTITNFMLPAEKSRLELEFTVAFEHGAKVVSEAIVEAMQELEGKLKGPLETFKYSVRPTLVSRDGIVIQVRYWVVPRYISPAKTRGLIIDAVTGKLEDRQITLAYHSFRTVPYEA